MEAILLPSKIEFIPGKTKREATLVVEPCVHGYGTTIGNALRRVMLSSLPGAAVTAVKIKGAGHEFSSIPGVKEDVLELVLNLKLLRLRVYGDGPVRLMLSTKGNREVTAKDIEVTSDIEVCNPDLHIATLTDKKAELEMEIFVEVGRGYVPVEERVTEKNELGMIAIDALYSPVRDVGIHVENVRVGQITNFDKLLMNIETDGTITPEEAVHQSIRILLDHFTLFLPTAPDASAPVLNADAETAPMVTASTSEDEISADAKSKKAKKKK